MAVPASHRDSLIDNFYAANAQEYAGLTLPSRTDVGSVLDGLWDFFDRTPQELGGIFDVTKTIKANLMDQIVAILPDATPAQARWLFGQVSYTRTISEV